MLESYMHGVEYLPDSQEDYSKGRQLDVHSLSDLHICFVRVQWVDYTSIVRYRVLPLAHFLKILRSPRPSVALAKVTLGLVYLTTAAGFSPSGEYLLRLDLSTLRLVPYEPETAVVTGQLEEKTPIASPRGELSAVVDLCPRTMLARVTEDAKVKAGVEFLVGFETEFILLKSTKPVVPVSVHAWTASNALLSGSVQSRVLREITEALDGAGIEVTMYHPEAAPGQYEVVTGPLPPLAAADALILTRETIVNVAAKHNLRATFAPRVFMTSAGSSAHTHISIHSVDPSIQKPVDKMSKLESSLLSALLKHLPSLTAITLPIPASFKRVADGVWSGGTYVCWGTEAREAPIRLTNATSPSSRNFELRFLDGTCNPYLALTGIIGVGYRGVLNQEELDMKDCPGPITAAQMIEEERKSLGITQRVPLTWTESRENFSKSKTMAEIYGLEFMEKYLSVNKTLGEELEQDDDETASITRLIEFY